MSQSLPSEDSAAGRVARRLARLQGPAIQAPDGSTTCAELLALGDGITTGNTTVEKLREQAFCDTATDMLDEWEGALGIRIPIANGTSLDPFLLRQTDSRRAIPTIVATGLTMRVIL